MFVRVVTRQSYCQSDFVGESATDQIEIPDIERQQRHEHLATAIGMYREMNMGFYLAQAETVLAKLG